MFKLITTTLCGLAAAATLFTADLAAASPLDTARVASALQAAAPALEGKLNVNEANEKQWEMLPGIGPATAKKLVAYRTKQRFAKPIQVMRIKGIGRKTFNKLQPYLTTEGPTTLRVVK